MIVLFIDDEPSEMDSFKLELEMAGYQVVFKTKTDDAWVYFEQNEDSIGVVILDVMMPPGDFLGGEDTEGGLRTGALFYNKIRDKHPNVHVIILTNVSDASLVRRFAKDPRCTFVRKEDVFPFQLVERVAGLD